MNSLLLHSPRRNVCKNILLGQTQILKKNVSVICQKSLSDILVVKGKSVCQIGNLENISAFKLADAGAEGGGEEMGLGCCFCG